VTGALSGTDWNTFNGKLNLTSPITGYTVGANTALAATDTILGAFGKIQGQINARISGTIASGQVAVGTGGTTIEGTPRFLFSGSTINLNSSFDPFFEIEHTAANDTVRTNISFIGIRTTRGIASQISSSRRGLLEFRTQDLPNAGNPPVRWSILNTGILQAEGSQSITTTANGNISISPNGTGLTLIGASATPTNTLDVNGTTRIRTISNLGSTATRFLVASATGVISERTSAELASDIGAIAESTQVVATSGTINDLSTTASTVVFTGATVTLTGIVALVNGTERTLINNTGSNLTISYLSGSSSANNRFFFTHIIPDRGALTIKYSTNLGNVWGLKAGVFFGNNDSIGSFTNQNLGIGRVAENNVRVSIRSAGNTDGTFALAIQRLDATRILEVRNLTSTFYVPTSFGGAGNRSDSAVISQAPTGTFGFSYLWNNNAGSNIGAIEKNGDIVSQRHLYIGATNWFDAVPANNRAVIRGIGTTTANTLLLEDSAGTDNVRFLDNGQILFLRLPTSSAGLPAGSLWNNGGVINIV
jgi:hypothetical protein